MIHNKLEHATFICGVRCHSHNFKLFNQFVASMDIVAKAVVWSGLTW